MSKLGDFVTTDHGTGTVVGYELLTKSGCTLLTDVSQDDIPEGSLYRLAIRLDEGHTWSFNGLYYAWPREVK